MEIPKPLFSVAANMRDLVIVSVIDSPSSHLLRTKVERIDSCRRGITPDHLGATIEFYRGPPTWGNIGLEPGGRALLSVGKRSDVFNGYPWRGHIWLEDLDGAPCAALKIEELWSRDDLPESVKAASPHPTKGNHSAIRFAVWEVYLKALIEASHAKLE
jgi:hypothetical protein